ncbi:MULTISPECIES: hypothetical protein [Nostoc]|uniref:Uncharacterized protein n=1 Tax=Nostoc paludosum FACHB-159 TaxID=2692908 RepID=A0ABR8KEN4_9NOSO|nr:MULTISPECIES: hypothetical protein [Nostoc]MBD2679349.1 hypothetical protein [Nostoc sp. FACHB-857]MBD2737294.1 hypothetical protein [Nostoc paludosum FACHB-159]
MSKGVIFARKTFNQDTKSLFEQAVVLDKKNLAAASKLFTQCLETCASDRVLQIYLHRCEKISAHFN